MTKKASYLLPFVFAAGVAWAGEPTPTPAPTPAPAPAPAPVPAPAPAPAPAAIDWPHQLADFQGADAAKQQAAAKVFFDAGAQGHAQLGSLLKHSDPQVVKRATELRQKIEEQSQKMFNDMVLRAQKPDTEPLTAAALRELQQGWLRTAVYSCDKRMNQACLEQARAVQNRIKQVEDTTKEVAALDAQLKQQAEGSPVVRASLQLKRAEALKTLQRNDDALQAAQAAAEIGGKSCRLTPAALKLMAELYAGRQDQKILDPLCTRIIQEYPHSLEVKFAYKSLIESFVAQCRWDDALKQVKEYLAVDLLDEGDQSAQDQACAQDEAYSLISSLIEAKEYMRVGAVCEWLLEALPLDRVVPDIPKWAGQCSEYLHKDFAKAEKMYQLLKDQYPDVVNPEEMAAALARVKLKAQGKFPAEPKETDDGPAGALAKFLQAFRKHDGKALALIVPKKEAAKYETIAGEEVVEALFADFVVTAVKLDDKQESAVFSIDHYDATATKPAPLTQKAVKEDGQWKVQWNSTANEERGKGGAVPLEGLKNSN